MKVALVCPYAWDRPGGVQSHVRALARTLGARGHRVLVLAPGSPGEADDFEIFTAGRPLLIPANGSVAPIAISPLAAAAIRRALKAFDPDVVHVHEPLIPSLSLPAVWGAKRPTVGTFHTAAASHLWYGAARPILARAVTRLTVRTAVSDAARSLVERYFPGEYVLTPNGVEVERFATAEPLDLGPRKKVLFLSRLEKRKAPDVLIDAMSMLRDVDAELIIAGAGPLEAELRALASDRGVDVRFLGEVAEEDVPRLYRSADVFCAPATGRESFGIVLVEAMAAGLPVICSDIPGFRSAARDAAIFVPPGAPAELADALRRLLTDDREMNERKKASRLRAAALDWDGLAAGVESIYQQARGRA